MTFSIYSAIQIFFADPYLVHLQKYWHHLQQKILIYHLQRVLLLTICYQDQETHFIFQEWDKHQKL